MEDDESSRELMALEQQRRFGGNEDNLYMTRRGRYVTLRWQVRNLSSQPWPDKVQLKALGDCVPVKPVNLNHVRLQPGAVKLLMVTFRVPLEVEESIVVYDFGLFDLSTNRQFGSVLSAALEVGEKEEEPKKVVVAKPHEQRCV